VMIGGLTTYFLCDIFPFVFFNILDLFLYLDIYESNINLDWNKVYFWVNPFLKGYPVKQFII